MLLLAVVVQGMLLEPASDADAGLPSLDLTPGIMLECLQKPPQCNPHESNCGSDFAYVYFYSFVILVSIILLNLMTAVRAGVGGARVLMAKLHVLGGLHSWGLMSTICCWWWWCCW